MENKSREKSLVIKELRKRNSELTKSRDTWKNKYQSVRKLGLNKGVLEGDKAKHHQYALSVVMWVMYLQNYGKMSLRSCRHCIKSLYLVMGLRGRVPSHESIRIWLIKQGNNRVEASMNRTGSRVLYVDESIVIGGEKILLFLGIATTKIPTI